MSSDKNLRFIHTADWHLGRLFHGVHLTDDQAYVLDQLVAFAREANPDAVLVAGDVYDRAVPPPEAVALLDDVLSRMVLDLKVPVVLIAGNHDSPDRLSFGSRLLAQQRLHVIGALPSQVAPVLLEDKAGPVYVYPLPYAEPAVVREKLGQEAIRDHDSAMRALLGQISGVHQPGERSIVMAHCFIGGGEETESERPLSVGGVGAVDQALFSGFDYVALGHLHRPQPAGGCQYAGSLLKYSFSEAAHTKSVSLVEMDPQGKCTVERISLAPRRDCRRIEGYLADILNGPPAGESRDDYLSVSLLDTGAILDVMGRLREVYPNVLQVERPCLTGSGMTRAACTDHGKMTDEELFSSFFTQATEETLTDEQVAVFASTVESLRQRERESLI